VVRRVVSYLLGKLYPNTDVSQVKPIREWAVSQQMTWVDYLAVEAEQDDNLQDYFWNKTGSFFLKPYAATGSSNNTTTTNNSGCWCADFSYMEKYAIKAGFQRYGGKLIFDAAGNLLSITYLGQTYLNTSVTSNNDIDAMLSTADVADAASNSSVSTETIVDDDASPTSPASSTIIAGIPRWLEMTIRPDHGCGDPFVPYSPQYRSKTNL